MHLAKISYDLENLHKLRGFPSAAIKKKLQLKRKKKVQDARQVQI
jgi:hypothetical protein